MRLRKLITGKMPSHEFTGEVMRMRVASVGLRKCGRWRGAAGKAAVFGPLKRGGKVYMSIIPDAKTALAAGHQGKDAEPDSIAYTDAFGDYNALDVGEVSSPSDQPLPALCRAQEAHQWHQELLEPSQAPSTPL